MSSSTEETTIFPLKFDFAKRLMAIGAIKFQGPDNPDGFKLKLHEAQPDAPLSPIFLNLRGSSNPKPGPLTRHDFSLAAQLMHDVIRHNQLHFDYIAPLPHAGDPFGRALCEEVHWKTRRLLQLIKTDYPDGTRRITGIDPTSDNAGLSDRVLIVDDLIAQADTKLEGIKIIQSNSLVASAIIVLVDRQQGGIDKIKTATGVDAYAVYTMTELLDYYVQSGNISAQIRRSVRDYIGVSQ